MISMSPFMCRMAGRIAILLAAGALTACSVEVDQGGGGGYRPHPRPQACTREYAPVCGANGRDRQTFANACEARRSGYGIIGNGACQAQRPGGGWDNDGRGRDRDRDRDRPDWRDRDRDRGNQTVCTMDYRPVCGQRGNGRKTFGNACSADAAGYRIIGPGECSSY